MPPRRKPDQFNGGRPLSLTPAERRLRAQIAANTRWANTSDEEASEIARKRINQRFLDEVDPDGTMDPAERERRAENARSAYMQKLAMKSIKVRRQNARLARPTAEQVEEQIADAERHVSDHR